MKKQLILATIVMAFAVTAQAQRFAYVNTDYILDNMPEYKKAQEQIDKLTQEWRGEADKKQKEIDELYRSFQNEQYLLTEDQKKAKISEIETKEKALKDYQKSVFGYEGLLYQKRQELVKPIQDKVYEAIEKYARERGYDFIFDKSSSTTILWANPDNDKSDEIIKKLGYTPTKTN
ncbi:MAG TPA: OmpH family outer membrane protein [Chitinophagales bacterium]|nr:OmpH family outer membrane protein [Chitinophagales bacterium]HMU68632.1 OmpH family outer membrane protein [Chitinophagales bacterium]HMZ89217.1 OmpH family outer membrane protein [Chitinophagales bacterium]HNE45123.1 OmpH family outer membrane protein [Chitinophagales bacterium]HNF68779.1 OmpH family outer membrane protein [Chitinophagales bacterium]